MFFFPVYTNTQKSQSERDDHRVTQRQYCWQGLQWGLLQTHSGWPKSPHTARVISCLCACHFHPLAHSGYRYGDPSECPETSRSSRHLQSANTKEGVKVKKRSNILTWQLLMHFKNLHIDISIYLFNVSLPTLVNAYTISGFNLKKNPVARTFYHYCNNH